MGDNFRIVFTGSSGSLGSQMPNGPIPLRTRLESSVEARVEELMSLTHPLSGFIHLAALTRVDECENDPERARNLNVTGALKWFEAASRLGCEHFVFVSTAHVFAPAPGRVRLTPDSPVSPRSVYARTKLEAEQALRERQRRSGKTKLTVARVFSLLSDRIRPGFLQASLIERAKQRDLSPIPGLDNVRDFINAREACQILVRLVKTPEAPDLILVCSGVGTSVRQLAEKIFKEQGLDPQGIQPSPGRPDDVPYIVGVPTDF